MIFRKYLIAIICSDIAIAMWFAIQEGMIFFYIIILFLIDKHQHDCGVIFAGICAKQRCFLKSVEYDV